MAEVITSRDNAKIKYAVKLAGSAAFRQSEKSFLAEGLKLCLELSRGLELKTLFYTQKALEKSPDLAGLCAEQYCIMPHVAEKLADVGTNQGVFGIFALPQPTLASVLRPGGRYLALERVQDPGNMGTLLRSAVAFGFDGVLVSAGCAGVFSAKTLRACMGAVAQLPVVEVEDLPAALGRLRQTGITCLAAALYHSRPLSEWEGDYPNGLCVVIGSEGQGLRDETVAACNAAVRIPMTDRIESLNAGVAGSILLWHFRGAGL